MRCKRCHNFSQDGAIYCPFCGTKLIVERTAVKVPPPTKTAHGVTGRVMVNGNRVRITAETEREYYIKAAAVKTELIKEQPKRKNDKTVGKIVEEYIASKESVLSPSTIAGYKKMQKSRLLDAQKITPEKVNWQKEVNKEVEKHVSTKTLVNAVSLFSSALKSAGFTQINVTLPQRIRKEHAYLDSEQIPIFLQAIKGHRSELAFLLGLHSLRLSEILNVSKEDVTDGTIRVHGSAVMDAEYKLIHKETNKNTSSRREIPILIERVNELVASAGDNCYLVQLTEAQIYKDVCKICEENGLPKIGIHGLRHSFVSLGYQLGLQPKLIQALGGYSGSDTVDEIYTHLSKKQLLTAADTMRQFYVDNCKIGQEIGQESEISWYQAKKRT